MSSFSIAGNKKIYFLSDFHLGAPNTQNSLQRERKIVSFLESIRHDAAQIIICGDIFDFWYEYKTVVPKGFVRLLGKLAEITDSGIPVILFAGNHDMWMRGYFDKEMNIPVYFEPKVFEWNEKKFFTNGFIQLPDALVPKKQYFFVTSGRDERTTKVFDSPWVFWTGDWDGF